MSCKDCQLLPSDPDWNRGFSPSSVLARNLKGEFDIEEGLPPALHE